MKIFLLGNDVKTKKKFIRLECFFILMGDSIKYFFVGNLIKLHQILVWSCVECFLQFVNCIAVASEGNFSARMLATRFLPKLSLKCWDTSKINLKRRLECNRKGKSNTNDDKLFSTHSTSLWMCLLTFEVVLTNNDLWHQVEKIHLVFAFRNVIFEMFLTLGKVQETFKMLIEMTIFKIVANFNKTQILYFTTLPKSQ